MQETGSNSFHKNRQMDNLIFVDSIFDKENTKEYSLSIRVSPGGFSFCMFKEQKCAAISRTVNYKLYYNTDLVTTFKDFIRDNELLNAAYKQVKIIWDSADYTTVPNEFFTEEFAGYSYQLCCGSVSAVEILWDKMRYFNAHVVYAVPKAFYQCLNELYPDTVIYHGCTFFFDDAVQQSTRNNNGGVFACIENNYCSVIVPNAENRHFVTHFEYKAASDLVYFLLNIYKSRQLNPENIKLILSGNIDPEDNIKTLLEKYIGRVEVEELPQEYRIKSGIEDKAYNIFVNLLKTNTCG